ncbi:efflux RND transporter periplasmic adaptor subunit [Phenylobacterium sp.]|uniref:efflux RND transporter periplasmic adaptor subunit n=1 Tax=Phenylobacterium sp. TaxID=1871053 RepID=UPI002C703A4D|nr:efflux RND transporter periplasmic adaptor subunit [Phenylobacterium sp.]HLZ77219.1 efflux RND transporter periplasmic adaptor subunit [Phenylobacterium sp.]
MRTARISRTVDPANCALAGTGRARGPSRPLRIALALGVAGVLAACSAKSPPSPPPAPEVTAITVQASDVPNVIELPGRVVAVRTAEVRARVDGIVQRRLYQEGSDVRAGGPLFQIDPRDLRAALEAAQADFRRVEAARVNAAQVVGRYEPLVTRKAISAQEYDAAVSALRQAEAQAAQARASVDRAQLQLSYTAVDAPIAGQAGRAQVTEGALVSAAGATLMTTVEQLAPIYVTFAPSSSSILDINARVRAGNLKIPQLNDVEVHLILENGAAYGPTGHLDFADRTVDPATGGQTIRALFPNPDQVLLPGQFVRGRIYAGVVRNGVRIPQRAVQLSNGQARVTVVNRDGTVSSREVELGDLEAAAWVINSGLGPGDMVVVDGWQKVQPGQKVRIRALDASARPSPKTPGQAGR